MRQISIIKYSTHAQYNLAMKNISSFLNFASKLCLVCEPHDKFPVGAWHTEVEHMGTLASFSVINTGSVAAYIIYGCSSGLLD